MLRSIKILFFGFSLSLCAIPACSLAAKPTQGKVINRVIAIVNKDVITQATLDHQIQTIQAQAKQAHAPVPSYKILRKQVLDQLINRSLQLQTAKNAGIRVDTLELNKALNLIASQNHMTLDQFYQSVKKQGWTIAGFRKEIKEEITIQKLQGAELGPQLKVTDQEIQDFITKQDNRPGVKLYHLLDIFVGIPEKATKDQINQAHQQAEQVTQNLASQKDFKKVAIEAANASKNIHVGDLGWRPITEVPPAFANKIKSMKKGQISGILMAPNGFHILKLADQPKLEKHAKMTKKQAHQILFQQKLEKAVKGFINGLKQQAYVKIIEN